MNSLALRGLCLLWLLTGAAQAEEFHVTPNAVVRFASAERGREILTTRDEFVRALSPFDRSARMGVAVDPGEEKYLEFVRGHVLEWEAGETNQLAKRIATLAPQVKDLTLPLPRVIEFVKTTGAEEGGAAYTRGAAIVLPREKVINTPEDLLAHELFHVLSRHSRELRERLYGIIGFEQIDAVPLPGDMAAFKITNPDGVHNNVMIRVRFEGEELPVVPVLYSSEGAYDPAKGGPLFRYLTFRLMGVEQTDGRFTARLRDDQPQLLTPAQVSGFYEQIGRNTGYIIHPDEVLAENFVHLLNGATDLPDPRIVSEMKRILQSAENPSRP